jgi:hypothetical protein
VRTAMLAMFGREPAGHTDTADRRALLQVVADDPIAKAAPLLPKRAWRRLSARW